MPLYDLRPSNITFLRRLIEIVIRIIILFTSNNKIKFIFSFINSNYMGYLFQSFRKIWKNITKPTKRKGLKNLKFTKDNNNRLKEFLK